MNPADNVRRFYIELINRDSDNANKHFEQSDKFITWIIGFCIAGISLLLSNKGIIELIGESYYKLMILLIALSAITGVLYRWLSKAYINEFYVATMNIIYGLNHGDHLKVLTDTSELNDIDSMKAALKNDFNYDVDAFLALCESVEMSNEITLDSLKKFHEERGGWYTKQIENTSELILELYKESYGISDRKMEKSKVFSNKKLKFYRGASNTLYICSLFLFLISFVIIIIAIL